MKTKYQRLKNLFLTCSFTFLLLPFNLSFADEAKGSSAATDKVVPANPDKETHESLKITAENYFKERKYNECAEYLESLAQKEETPEPALNYLIALTRYNQLKYLEESQNWNDYFNNGEDYRQQIQSYAQEAIESTSLKDSVNIYARLILWKLHKDQGDSSQEEILSGLLNAVLENAKSAEATAGLLKDVADQLLLSGDKIYSRRLYKAYVEKLAASKISDEELNASATGFFKDQNLELSEALYDVYISRIAASMPKEKLIPALTEIAKQFTYKPAGIQDMLYAEKVFAKIEEAAGKDVFDEALLYLRAFNLEKAKDFAKAKDVYLDLINGFPAGTQINEAIYKTGIIYVYILRDLKEGRNYFEKLAQKETLDPQIISSFYQLGLLSQWESDLIKAKQYYNKLIEVAKDAYAEKINLAKERLKEIDEAKPMDYNLKSFLDASLKPENAVFDTAKTELQLTPYNVKKNESLSVATSASAAVGESGCMPVELQYLWSGDLGSARASAGQHSFETAYSDSGTKQINLVVVSPAGFAGRSMDLADVQ